MYQRLLLILDAEQEYETLVCDAMDLAQQLNASVHALVVGPRQQETVSHYLAELTVYEFNARESRQKALVPEIFGAVKSTARDRSVSVTGTSVVRTARLKDLLCTAEQTKSDVIVISPLFRPSLSDLLLGPKAHRIAKRAALPLLLLSPPAKQHMSADYCSQAHGLGLL